MKRLVIALCIIFCCSIDVLAHSGFIQHGEDIMAYANGKHLVNGITKINSQNIDVQKKADLLMNYLKQEVPEFIKKACNGSVRRKIEGQRFRLI